MYAISEKQQIALYVLWGLFRRMTGFSGLDVAFDKSKNERDNIEDIIAQFVCIGESKNEVKFFTRFSALDEIEVWSEDSSAIHKIVKDKVAEIIPDAIYAEVNCRHRWKSNMLKEWFDAQYKEMYD